MEDSESLKRFIDQLRHHLEGWQQKARHDFSKGNFDDELAKLSVDPVYAKFHLATPEYVLIRLMGRMSVSIGRRLGEIYDKVPRLAAQSRFGVSKDSIVTKFNNLELDIRLQLSEFTSDDQMHAIDVVRRHLNGMELSSYTGAGIEIRYNFNPNDSSRLRKDKELAAILISESYLPIYLVFAENSPRMGDAVASLRRAGWNFLVGVEALDFMADLVGFDITEVLDRPDVSSEIEIEVSKLMAEVQFRKALDLRKVSGVSLDNTGPTACALR